MDQRPSSVPANLEHRSAQLVSSGQPLLNRHGEDQRGLSVRASPHRRARGRHGVVRPRQTVFRDVTGVEASGLPDVQSPRASGPDASGHRHPDARDREIPQARGNERRRAVEVRPRACFEDRSPEQPPLRDRPRVEAQRLRSHPLPPPSGEVGTDLRPRDAGRVELATAEYPTLGRSAPVQLVQGHRPGGRLVRVRHGGTVCSQRTPVDHPTLHCGEPAGYHVTGRSPAPRNVIRTGRWNNPLL